MSTPLGPQDERVPAGGRRVMSTGAAITLIAIGAILRFALAPGSPHGLNVHVVGVVLILAGVLGLVLSLLLLLVRTGPRQQRQMRRLTRQERPDGYYNLPASDHRLARRRRAAAENVAAVREDDRFFDPDTPARPRDDL
jgi:Na+/melibiose symporter-like transporter